MLFYSNERGGEMLIADVLEKLGDDIDVLTALEAFPMDSLKELIENDDFAALCEEYGVIVEKRLRERLLQATKYIKNDIDMERGIL